MCVNTSRFLTLRANSSILNDPRILLSMAWSIRALKSMLAAQFMIIWHCYTNSRNVTSLKPSPSFCRSPWLYRGNLTSESPSVEWSRRTCPCVLASVCRSRHCWQFPSWSAIADWSLPWPGWGRRCDRHNSARTAFFQAKLCLGSQLYQ